MNRNLFFAFQNGQLRDKLEFGTDKIFYAYGQCSFPFQWRIAYEEMLTAIQELPLIYRDILYLGITD